MCVMEMVWCCPVDATRLERLPSAGRHYFQYSMASRNTPGRRGDGPAHDLTRPGSDGVGVHRQIGEVVEGASAMPASTPWS